MSEYSSKNQRHENIVTVCEGAICIALACVLSYLKIDIGAQGGSINFTMVPLIIFVLRRGALPGFAACFAFGMLKFLLGGEIIAWQSIVFDYILAYGVIGFAFTARYMSKNNVVRAIAATLVGCIARYAVHFLSGVTIYAQWAPDEFLGMKMGNVAIYSLLYNGLYMIPCTVCTLIVAPVLYAVLERNLPVSKDRKSVV